MQRAHLERLLTELQGGAARAPGMGVHICRACVELLVVDGAAIMLVDQLDQLSSFGVSDAAVGRVEDLQFTVGEGPGTDAHTTSRLVWVPDLLHATRWTAYGTAATEEGFAAVFALPLRVGAVGLGAL